MVPLRYQKSKNERSLRGFLLNSSVNSASLLKASNYDTGLGEQAL